MDAPDALQDLLAADARRPGHGVGHRLEGRGEVGPLVVKGVVEVEGDDLEDGRDVRDQFGNWKYSW
jgi:hypothetical protein